VSEVQESARVAATSGEKKNVVRAYMRIVFKRIIVLSNQSLFGILLKLSAG